MRAEALPTMKTHTLSSEVRLAVPIDQVFSFFADAYNLAVLTPPWLSFQVLTPRPIMMQVGMRIDYRLRIYGLPVRWQSEITAWPPPTVSSMSRGEVPIGFGFTSTGCRKSKTAHWLWTRSATRCPVVRL